MQMSQFHYQATTQNSEPQSGEIAAESLSEANLSLKSQGLTVLSIRQEEMAEADRSGAYPPGDELASLKNVADGAVALERAAAPSGGWPPAGSDDDRTIRTHLAYIVHHRETIAPALSAFAEELPPGRMRHQMRQLAGQIGRGATVDALRGSHDLTAALLPTLAGGVGTAPAQRALHAFVAEAALDGQLDKQRRGSLFYPLMVLAVAMIVLVFLCLAVVPMLGEIYNDFGLDLPTITNMVLTTSNLIRFHAAGLIGTVVVLAAALFLLVRFVSTWSVTAGLIGYLTAGATGQVAATASFTRRLAGLVDAGLSLPGALRLAGHRCGRDSLRRAADSLADSFEHGLHGWTETSAARRLPATLVYALQLHAAAGPPKADPPSARLLHQLAEMYAERVRDRFNWFTGMFAPFSILMVGLVIMIVVLALFMPLISLIEGLS